MERTLETITINNALEVVRLKGELKFKHPLGYTRPSGYCFKHPVKGFFAFKGDTEPYMPCGGKKAFGPYAPPNPVSISDTLPFYPLPIQIRHWLICFPILPGRFFRFRILS